MLGFGERGPTNDHSAASDVDDSAADDHVTGDLASVDGCLTSHVGTRDVGRSGGVAGSGAHWLGLVQRGLLRSGRVRHPFRPWLVWF